MTVVSDYRSLLSNTSWDTGAAGAAITLTYSFSTAPTAYLQGTNSAAAATFSAANTAEQVQIQAAVAQFAAISGITFKQVFNTPGDITFGFYNLSLISGSSGEAGLGDFPSTGDYIDSNGVPQVYSNFLSQGGDIYFDSSYQTNPSFAADFAHIAVHEIGHALGLKHPFDQAPSGPSYTLDPALDNGSNTVMAYAGIRSATLEPLDIAAIQAMYGSPATATHPFTDVWNAATESLTVTGNGAVALALYGSGGNDTLYSLGQHDALAGGEGNDTFYLAGRPAAVNGGTGTDTVVTGLAYSPLGTTVQGSGDSLRYIYLPAYADFQTYVNVATIDFTNGSYDTASSTFTAYPAVAWTGSGWSVGGGAASAGLPATTAASQVALTGGGTAAAPGVISSSGTAGSLNLDGGYASVSGSYSLGMLTVGSVSGAGLTVAAGGSVTVAGAAIVKQTSVQAAVGQPALTVATGGTLQVGSLVLQGATGAGAGAAAVVAAGGTLEVGAAGHAAAGVITIDAGSAITGSGVVGSAVIDNGTIIAAGQLTLAAAVGGTGQMQIGAGGDLVLSGGVGVATSFADATGTLNLVNPTGLQAGAISGFTAGDVIEVQSPSAVTGANYVRQGAGSGLLQLLAGNSVVATLNMAGNWDQSLFQVSSRNGLSDITVTAPDPMFDAAYYLSHNPDVAAAGVDPYLHYLAFGWKEGRDPSALFDTRYYLTQNPDVSAAGANPLLHFEQFGWKEGRGPSLVFDDAKYLAANPDIAAAGVDPLLHYMPVRPGRGPHGLPARRHRAGRPAGQRGLLRRAARRHADPGRHGGRAAGGLRAMTPSGWQKGLNPDAFFDTAYYLSHNPDVAAAHIDPLLHYETYRLEGGPRPLGQLRHQQIPGRLCRREGGRASIRCCTMSSFGLNEGRAIYSAPA